MPHARKSRPTREESRAQTRERLLASARREVAARGASASVRDIAEAAGLSQGALYANFDSKEALLLEIMRAHMRQEAESLTALLDGACDGEAALSALDAWASGMNADPDWATLAIELQLHANRSAGFATEYDRVYADHRQALGRLVSRLFGMLGVELPADPAELATGLMALAHGLAIGRSGRAAPAAGRTLMVFLRALVGVARA